MNHLVPALPHIKRAFTLTSQLMTTLYWMERLLDI